MKIPAGTPASVLAAAVLVACGASAKPTAPAIEPDVSVASPSAETTALPTDDEKPRGAGIGIGTTPACDRVTPAELSAAFNATFADGREIADRQCAFESDGSPQLLIAVYPAHVGPSVCETIGSEFETVEIAGHPGFWDQAGAQARVCLDDGSIAAILYGGGGDNSVHRGALIDLVARATDR